MKKIALSNNYKNKLINFIIKHDYKIGLVISVIFLLMILNFFILHIYVTKIGLFNAVMINTCIPCCAVFVIGFFMRSRIITAASIVLIFRYGLLGFFGFIEQEILKYFIDNIIKLFPLLIFIQIQHIIMTSAVLYVAITLVFQKKYKQMILGFIIGIIILIPFMIYQHYWILNNPEIINKFFIGILNES